MPRPQEGEQPDGKVVQHLHPDGYIVWDGYPVMVTTAGGSLINAKSHEGKVYSDEDDYRQDPFWELCGGQTG